MERESSGAISRILISLKLFLKCINRNFKYVLGITILTCIFSLMMALIMFNTIKNINEVEKTWDEELDKIDKNFVVLLTRDSDNGEINSNGYGEKVAYYSALKIISGGGESDKNYYSYYVTDPKDDKTDKKIKVDEGNSSFYDKAIELRDNKDFKFSFLSGVSFDEKSKNLVFTSSQIDNGCLNDKEVLMTGPEVTDLSSINEIMKFLRFVTNDFFMKKIILEKLGIVNMAGSRIRHFFGSYTNNVKGDLSLVQALGKIFSFISIFFFLLLVSAFSTIVNPHKDFLQNKNFFFLDMIGLSRSTQFITWIILSFINGFFIFSPILTILILLNGIVIKNFRIELVLGFGLLFLTYFSFFFDLILVNIFYSYSFLVRFLLYYIAMLYIPFKLPASESSYYFVNFIKGIHPFISARYIYEKLTSEFSKREEITGFMKIPFFETIDNYSVGAAIIGSLIGFTIVFIISYYTFINADDLEFYKLNPMTYIAIIVKKILRRRKKNVENVAKLDNSKNWKEDEIDEKKEKNAISGNKVSEEKLLPTNDGLEVKGVSKIFSSISGSFKAVDDVSISVGPKQKIALLGHNGAGKTTFISCLTGLSKPTHGQVFFQGKRIRTSSDLFGRVGYCPQFTSCFKGFTVDENIDIILDLCSTDTVNNEKMKSKVLSELELEGHRKKLPEKLSGGQRRKLAFALAIVSKPELIVLDEPSTGVDVLSRKRMVKLVRDYCHDSIIILSTQIIEEAERFADKVLILNSGRKEVFDSLEGIKKKFGLNSYRLTVNYNSYKLSTQIGNGENGGGQSFQNKQAKFMKLEKSEIDSNKRKVEDFLRSNGKKFHIIRERSTRTTFSIVVGDYIELSEFYEVFSERKDEFGVESFGVNMATLEEVMNKESMRELKPSPANEKEQKNVVAEKLKITPSDKRKFESRNISLVNMLIALLYKRFNEFIGNPSLVFIYMAFLVFVYFSVRNNELLSNKIDKVEIDFSKVVVRDTDAKEKILLYFQPELFDLFKKHLEEYETENLLKYFDIENAKSLKDFKNKVQKENPVLSIIETVKENQSYGLWVSDMQEQFQDGNFELQKDYCSLDTEFENAYLVKPCEDFSMGFTFLSRVGNEKYITPLIDVWSKFLIRERLKVDVKSPEDKDFEDGDTSASDKKKDLKEKVDLIRKELGSSDLKIKSSILIGGYDSSTDYKMKMGFAEKYAYVIFGIIVMDYLIRNFLNNDFFSFSRELQLKYGLPKLGSIFFDILFESILIFLLHLGPILVLYFSGGLGVKSRFLTQLISTLYSGILTMVCFIYFLARYLGSTNAVRTFSIIFTFYHIIFSVVRLIIYTLFSIPTFFRYLDPYYSYYLTLSLLFQNPAYNKSMIIFSEVYSLVNLNIGNSKSDAGIQWTSSQYLDRFTQTSILSSLLIITMSVTLIVFYELNLLDRLKAFLLSGIIRRSIRCKKSSQKVKDETVEREQANVANIISTDKQKLNDGIFFKDLSKAYTSIIPPSSTVALCEFNLAIEVGESVAILGANGGGKSTTFKIMVKEIREDTGEIYIKGKNMLEGNYGSSILNKIAYTPQYESLSTYNTPRSVITLYCMLKGENFWEAKKLSKKIANSVNLGKNARKAIWKLSGGNRRKVAIGLSLLSDAQVLVLDEPTTGVDITNCREIWEVINNIATKRSLILASHSMQETEELCTKIAVLVGGNLKCIGSAETLKQKFGKEYEVSISFFEEKFDIDSFSDCLARKYSKRRIETPNFNSVKVFIEKSQCSISECIRFFGENKEVMGIESFLVNEMSLENVLAAQIEKG